MVPSANRRERLSAELAAVGDRLDPRVAAMLEEAIATGDVPSSGLDDRLASLAATEPGLARSTLEALRAAETLYRSTWSALAASLPDAGAFRPPVRNRARLHPLMAVVMALALAALVLHRCG